MLELMCIRLAFSLSYTLGRFSCLNNCGVKKYSVGFCIAPSDLKLSAIAVSVNNNNLTLLPLRLIHQGHTVWGAVLNQKVTLPLLVITSSSSVELDTAGMGGIPVKVTKWFGSYDCQ